MKSVHGLSVVDEAYGRGRHITITGHENVVIEIAPRSFLAVEEIGRKTFKQFTLLSCGGTRCRFETRDPRYKEKISHFLEEFKQYATVIMTNLMQRPG